MRLLSRLLNLATKFAKMWSTILSFPSSLSLILDSQIQQPRGFIRNVLMALLLLTTRKLQERLFRITLTPCATKDTVTVRFGSRTMLVLNLYRLVALPSSNFLLNRFHLWTLASKDWCISSQISHCSRELPLPDSSCLPATSTQLNASQELRRCGLTVDDGMKS